MLFALVKLPASLTVSVKLCVAGVPTPLMVVTVNGCVPPVPAAGVPLNVPVPLPLSTKVTPATGVPVIVSAGVGTPRW